MSETFEEYWGQNTTGQYGRIERVIAKNAWVTCEKSQQKKIEELEKKLAEANKLVECLSVIMEGFDDDDKKISLIISPNTKEGVRSIKKAIAKYHEKETQGE